jgi:hypothetical protein
VPAYWTLAQIIARVRSIISLPQQFQVSDQEITNRINDFYQTKLPVRLKPDEFCSTYRFQTVGAYQIATGDDVTQIFMGTLSTVPGVCGVGFSDSVETFKCNEDGTLLGTYGGSGTVNYTSGIYHLYFNTAPEMNAQIGVYYDTYTLPDNVLSLSAPAVVAGYPLQLVEDVETFWSHWPMYQPYYMGGAAPPIYMPNIPQECLIYDGRLTVRPVPDQSYLFEAASVLKPSALSDSVIVLKDLWGPFIANEVAYEWLIEKDDLESASELSNLRSQALSDCLSPFLKPFPLRNTSGSG